MGMMSQQRRLDVVSNNIANVNTAGYKKDTTVTSTFDQALARRTNDLKDRIWPPMIKSVGPITYGALIDEIHTDFSAGPLKTTGGTYDLAIEGGGFFVVNTPNGLRYTRDGTFTVDKDDYLRTADGGFVQGRNGNIRIPHGMVSIERNGEISVGDEPVDQLRMVDFEDYTTLRKQAKNNYSTTAQTTEKPVEGGIIQGTLEVSNVNIVKEMVDLITINRIFESNQKMIQTIDTTLQRSVQEVGRK